MELYISYLRKKIDVGREPMIHTVRGAGYGYVRCLVYSLFHMAGITLVMLRLSVIFRISNTERKDVRGLYHPVTPPPWITKQPAPARGYPSRDGGTFRTNFFCAYAPPGRA